MARPDPAQPHLWAVDVVRLLTFSAVIAVHTLAFTEQPDNRAVAGLMMLLQYGREVFFALTGFVLVYTTMNRPLRPISFWRKRMLYVAVPYVVWTVVYYAYFVLGPAHMTPSWSGMGWDLLYGGAEYHLYFLLVTLQLYLAFPLISGFVHRTADRAVPILAGATAVNLAWLAAVAYVPAPGGGAGWLWLHAYEILPTYTMYVLAGCYAAVHLDTIQRVVTEHTRALWGIAGASAALALLAYGVQLPFSAPRQADEVIQPAMIFSCVAAAIAVYLIGSKWAAGARRNQRTIEVLSDASFGVYLAHPLVLQVLTDYFGFGNLGQKLSPVLATVLGYAITAGGATLISLAARRTPLSLALSGRPWRQQVKRRPAPVPALATAGMAPC
ncbi:MAG TPA: acyltransferase [Acidimicrobiales bacterium]|jgi:peptidoglycan/LPS O-acetylase OafA/YrhL|nr:acyltransferase [Acidimicrobiales bacterium]